VLWQFRFTSGPGGGVPLYEGPRTTPPASVEAGTCGRGTAADFLAGACTTTVDDGADVAAGVGKPRALGRLRRSASARLSSRPGSGYLS
jgi:hypothetical protein